MSSKKRPFCRSPPPVIHRRPAKVVGAVGATLIYMAIRSAQWSAQGRRGGRRNGPHHKSGFELETLLSSPLPTKILDVIQRKIELPCPLPSLRPNTSRTPRTLSTFAPNAMSGFSYLIKTHSTRERERDL